MSDKKHFLNKSMVEFVLDKASKFKYVDNYDIIDYQSDTEKYANALSQTPRLGHFIPCDENDVPLEEPSKKVFPASMSYSDSVDAYTAKYQQACDRVLFDGCKVLEYNKKVAYIKYENQVFGIGFDKGINKTLEDLIKYNLPLTEAGAKKFGYE